MPKLDNLEENTGDITINLKNSSIAEFTRRPLPSDKDVAAFEKLASATDLAGDDEGEIIDDQALDEEIDDSLNEIYQDDKGRMVDVRRMEVKKRRGVLFWILSVLFVGGGIAGAGYYGYRYVYLSPQSDAKRLELKIEGDQEVNAGQEFFYTVTYRNLTDVVLAKARLEVKYPDNFTFIDSYPAGSDEDKRVWEIPSIPARSVNTVKIKGMILGAKGKNGIVFASLSYMPADFSSEFKEEASFTTTVKDIGLDIAADYIATALVGQESEVDIVFSAGESSFIPAFRVSLEPQDNIEVKSYAGKDEANLADFEVVRPGVWQVKSVKAEEQVLPIKLNFKSKVLEEQELKLVFERAAEGDKYYPFHEEVLKFEVLKNDLNLALIINGSREDKGVNFGDTLHYSLVYNNKGETDLNDVYIMAVLESDYLDWTTLDDPAKGVEKGNTILWSKAEIPALETIKKHQEGTIDFSVKLVASGKIDSANNYEVKSYARYTVGGKAATDGEAPDDYRSNTITNRINSDLKIVETLRYFSEDNVPVGTGPNPPRVGQTTTYKVYWQVKNNLHELSDASVSLILPPYVRWDAKERATAGSITYNNSLNAVIWEIGRLPVTVFEAGAEFSVSVTPTDEDRNKIMVLTQGAKVTATDTVTKEVIERSTSPKTTKLDDDEIGKGDGIVE